MTDNSSKSFKTDNRLILVLGATGYVGGRLVSSLLERGWKVRATGRSLGKLKSRIWSNHPNVELVEVDVLKEETLKRALKDIDTAYYLVHSMNPQNDDFESADRKAARSMARLSSACHLRRIIYLGALGSERKGLSSHLKSRHEVSDILKSGDVPVTVLQAAMIIGSGSASFEILRYLVDRLPIMVTPKWVRTPNQPIAIRNVIEYLCGCVEKEETTGQTYDIGGVDVLSYLELMRIYARCVGLKKRIVMPVPILTPRLSSLWIHIVTPIPHYIAYPLAAGLKSPVVCHDFRIREIIVQELLTTEEAINKALTLVNANDVKTYWADAGQLPPVASSQEGDPDWAGGTVMEDKRVRVINATPKNVWSVISRIGGSTGWYHGRWLWMLRGLLDKLIGGVGMGRGRRSNELILVGDVVDFWRVTSVKENDHLSLSAEMKVPGRAYLEFKIRSLGKDSCELTQHASFQPHGLWGILYWYLLIPFHHYIFGGMIKKISHKATHKLDQNETGY